MTEQRPELEGLSLVLVGAFNPQIYQPQWFAREKLIPQGEADTAEVHVIHRQFTELSMGKFHLQALTERMIFSTTDVPSFEPLRDLVLGAFELLRHTPVRMLGINYDAHFRSASDESWHTLGDMLAPKSLWRSVLKSPGLRTLTIQGQRTDEYKGHVQVRVEPSKPVHPGVFISRNDHYDLGDAASAVDALGALKASYDSSMEQARTIVRAVLNGVPP
jgi:hypothetical protein